jgi:bifunctional DNA-binding transcriptional regulator/antitoxin component of YhaV-PrlF toxin-antitoxin module
MKMTRISQGGQVQVPAEVRRRWGTRNVVIEDEGGYLVISPIPADPIGAAMGSLAGMPMSSEEMLARSREEEAEAEERKWRQLSSTRRP